MQAYMHPQACLISMRLHHHQQALHARSSPDGRQSAGSAAASALANISRRPLQVQGRTSTASARQDASPDLHAQVFEYCESDLEHLIKDSRTILSAGDIKAYMRMILQALQTCHSHWVLHRDIKPNNFLITGTGTLPCYAVPLHMVDEHSINLSVYQPQATKMT